MKTQDTAINYIYDILTDSDGIQVPVYKYTKPTNTTPDEFVVLNALPISAGVMQKLIVNVNYYCKDIDVANGLPDIETLECRNTSLMTLLEEVTAVSDSVGYHIDFESQEYHREAAINKHYSNIRLNVKLFNEE
jgi:hypothetical protein